LIEGSGTGSIKIIRDPDREDPKSNISYESGSGLKAGSGTMSRTDFFQRGTDCCSRLAISFHHLYHEQECRKPYDPSYTIDLYPIKHI
jgi:hypothetical protein